MKKFFIVFLVLILIFFCFTACNKPSSIEFVSVRQVTVAGIDYEYYTYSFYYSQNMIENYYEVLVEYGNTSYFIQQAYIYFQLAYNINNTSIKVPNSTALFVVQIPLIITEVTVTLCRCNTSSTNDDFEILEQVYIQTFAV